MDNERFKHLQQLIDYDDAQMARMFNIDITMVQDFRAGRQPVPDKLAHDLELFADWASEVGDTAVKKDLAKKYLGG